MGLLEKLRQEHIEVRCKEPMALHTSFRIGGPAEFFVLPKNMEELRDALACIREAGVPLHVLGRGSNVLVRDEGLKGAVISMEKLTGSSVQGCVIEAYAGESLIALSRLAAEQGLSGLEFAYGIPGSLGGAVVMNAGAYGGEMKDVLVSAQVLTPDGAICTLRASELELGYRTSCIERKGYIVLSAVMQLCEKPIEDIQSVMQKNMQARKEKQPLEYPSAGSTFKRPEGYFAGKLIMDAGLRGFTVGGAQVSEKHCGFVINREGATAADVHELIRRVQEQVRAQFGVELECEIKSW
jgi:UDP-N-acetylmuramate dehydrogenase